MPPRIAFVSCSPVPLSGHSLTRYKCSRRLPQMSGVNGGIDYEIDLTTLPSSLRSRITYIQSGPDSPTSLIEAAREISLHTAAYPQTLPVLVDMLGFNNPVAANIAVDTLSHAGPVAIPYLLRGVAAFNYAVNAYALRALGRIGDESVLQIARACAERGPIPNVRRAACATLGMLRYQQGDEAWKCLMHLVENETDWSVRYAAIVALQNFVAVDKVDEQLVKQGAEIVKKTSEEQDVDPTVVARACVAVEVMKERLGERILVGM